MNSDKSRVIHEQLPREIIKGLEDIVGTEWVSEDRAIIEANTIFTIDAGAHLRKMLKDPSLLPGCLVLPETEEEVQAIVRLANRYKVPFYPFTNGQMMSAPFVSKSICIYLSRMNKVLDLDEKNMSMTIQPYVDYITVLAESRRRGLWNGGSGWHSAVAKPASQFSTAGMWQTDLRYGGLTRNVTGLNVVLPTGDLMRIGSAAIAGTGEFSFTERFPGPNLFGFFKNAVGTRGLITQITLKLHPWVGERFLPDDIGYPSISTYFEDAKKKKFDIPPAPKRHKIFWFEYPDEESLKRGVAQLADSGIGIGLNISGTYNCPMCSRTVEEAEKRKKEEFFSPNSGFMVLAGLSSERQLAYEEKVLRHIVEETGGKLLSDEYKPEVLEALAPWNLEFCVNVLTGMRTCRSGYVATLLPHASTFKTIGDTKQIWGEIIDKFGAPNMFSYCGREMPYGYIIDRGHQVITEIDHFPERTDRKGMETVLLSQIYGYQRFVQEGYKGGLIGVLVEPFTSTNPEIGPNTYLIFRKIRKILDPNSLMCAQRMVLSEEEFKGTMGEPAFPIDLILEMRNRTGLPKIGLSETGEKWD